MNRGLNLGTSQDRPPSPVPNKLFKRNLARPKVLATGILLVLGMCIWLALRGNRISPVLSDPAPSGSERKADSPGTLLHVSSGSTATTTRSGIPPNSVTSALSDAEHSPALDEMVVRGRIVDEGRNPISDVSVFLFSMRESWASWYKAPLIMIQDIQVQGFRVTSAADGRFEFHTPLPTADWISLRVEPSKYYGLEGRDFGPAGGRNQPRLILGLNSLGDLVLPSTGAVNGRVVGSDGSRIANASIVCDNRKSGGPRSLTTTDASGEFELGHVPEEAREFTAAKEGWLTGTARNIQVRRNATTSGVQFKLDRAPAISGIAVDETGVPQSGVYVSARPVSSGPGAGAQTMDDGTFTLFLVQGEPHILEVRGQSEYEPWGGVVSPAAVFEAGQTDVRIVLKRAGQFTFRVVDAATGAPIERFGIAIEHIPTEKYTWGRFSEAPELEEHPGGTVERGAFPGKQEVGIVAPGYAALQASVAPDPGASMLQTLRLARGGAISGRVALSGRACANAVLLLEGDRVRVDPSLPDHEVELLDRNKQLDVSELAGREQQFATDADGAIRINGVAPGTYRLTIMSRGAARRTLRAIVVANAGTRDLGDIQLEPESTIHGRVVLKPGLSVSGLYVWLDAIGGRITGVSLDGSFSFEGVESGEHVLYLGVHPPEVLELVSKSITVAPGSSEDVLFDLTASAPCNVELAILDNGRPVAGLTARWVVTKDGFEVGGDELGKSDRQGIIRGTCPNDFNVRFEVLSPAGVRLGRSIDTPSLSPGGLYLERIDLKTGTLVIVLPTKIEIPESGYVEVLLEHEDEQMQVLKCGTPGFRDQTPGAPVWKENRLELGEIAVGEYRASVGMHRTRRKDDSITGPWISTGIGSSFEGDIKVEEGKLTIIEVP